MIIKRVSLHNFKNYVDVTWQDIGEGVNVILGKNGRGKSNLYHALLFVFSDAYSDESLVKKREILNEKLSQEAVVAVEVLFDNRQRLLASVDSDEVQVRKSIDGQGKVQVELNSRPMSLRDFLGLLQCSGFQLSNPINFVMQGKVKQVSHTSETGLFALFCEIVGTSVYAQARVESEGIVTSTVLDEQKSFELLEEFRDRLSEIEVDKDDFVKFEETIKSGNRIYFTLYKRKVDKYASRLQEHAKLVEEAKHKLMTAVQEESTIRDSLSAIQSQMKEKEREVRQIELSIASITSEMAKVDFDTESFLSDGIETEASLDSIEPRSPSASREYPENLSKQRTDLLKEYASASQECLELQQQFEQSKRRYTTLKIDLEKSPEERKKLLAQKIELTDAEVSKKQQELAQTQALVESHAASLARLKQQYRENDSAKTEIAERINAIIQAIVLKKVEKNNLSAELAIKGADLCTHKQKRAELQTDLAEKKRAVGLASSEVPIGGILRLLEEAERRRVPGVLGVLFDLVSVQKQILSSFEALLYRKMFSIVVDDEKAASELVRLNKEIRGSKIVVVPLSWVQPVVGDFSYPDESEHIAFEQFVEVKQQFADKPQLHELVVDTCRGNILVEKLELAAKFAKHFDCNCVTLEGQVVYKQGFLSRLGYADPKNSKMADYLEFSHTKLELSSSLQRETDLQSEFEELRAKEAALTGELQSLTMQKESRIKEHEAVWSEASGLMKACIQEQKLLAEFEERLRSDSTVLSQLLSDRKSLEEALVSPRRGPSDDARKEVDAAFRSMYEHKELFTRKTQLLADLQAQLQHLEASSSKQQQASLGEQKRELERSFRRQVAEGISRSHSRTKDIIRDLSRRRDVKLQQKQSLQVDIGSLKSEEAGVEARHESKKSEIFRLKLDMQEKNQKKFDFQIGIDNFDSKIKSLSVNEVEEHEALWALKKRDNGELIAMLKKMMIAKLKYTQKDKANFEQLEEYFSTHRQYDSELRELNKSKKTFASIAETTDSVADETNQKMFAVFRKAFASTFKRFVPAGRADVELIGSFKKPQAPLDRRALRLKYTFDAQQPVKPHDDAKELLSPGQRSVVSLCVIFSLQKCFSPSFFCFDEVDAELDSVHCATLRQIVQDLSRSSQLFVTTFKRTSLPEDNTCYFAVDCSQDQPASILRVDPLAASRLLENGKRS